MPGVFDAIGNVFGKALGTFGGPALGPLGLFAAPIIGTLDDLFGTHSGGAREGGYASIPDNTTAGSTQNAIRKLEQIPSVIGTMVVSPVALTPSYTEVDNRQDLIVKQIFGLQGLHDYTDIQLNGVDIDTFDSADVEVQVREGTDSDTALTLIDKSVFEDIQNVTLPGFKYKGGSAILLQDSATPANSRPKWIYASSRENPDEIWIDLYFPRGLIKTASSAENSTALHVTVGGRKLPEMRIKSSSATQLRYRIKFVFAADPGGLNSVNAANETFPAGIFNSVDYHIADPDFGDWQADPYFGPYETSGATTSLTQHYDAGYDTCTFYLDPDDVSNPWPKQKYEIGVQRGASGYALLTNNQGRYFDIFASNDDWRMTDNTRDATERSEVVLRSISTYRDEHPINATGLFLIALSARNLTINSLSVKASGKTANYDGADWDTVEATANPAAWLRRLRTDALLAHPLPSSVLDETSLEELHDFCDTEGLEVNMVVEGNRRIENDLFEQICSAAYAKKNNGAKWGVWIDKDRSGEDPVGAITPLNSSELIIRKSFPEIPEALKISWRDSTNNYSAAEEVVRYRSGFSASTPNLKIISVAAPGKVTQAEVEEWGDRALAEMEARTTIYECDVDAEALQHEPGDLIALSYDTINLKADWGIVKTVQTDGGNVTGLVLEHEMNLSRVFVDIWGAPDPWLLDDIWTPADIGVGIRYLDGTVTHHEIDQTGETDTLTFVTPFATPTYLQPGCLVWSGALDSEAIRVYIDAITGGEDHSARIRFVDEAPSIHP